MDRALDEIVAERHVSSLSLGGFQPRAGRLGADELTNTIHREVVGLADAVEVAVIIVIALSTLVMA